MVGSLGVLSTVGVDGEARAMTSVSGRLVSVLINGASTTTSDGKVAEVLTEAF